MLVQLPFGAGPEATGTRVACEMLLNKNATAKAEMIVDATLTMLADMASYWSVDVATQPLSARAVVLHDTLAAEWNAVLAGNGAGFDLCGMISDAVELSIHPSMQDPAAARLRSQVLQLSDKVLAASAIDARTRKKTSTIGWLVPIVAIILGATVIGLVWND